MARLRRLQPIPHVPKPPRDSDPYLHALHYSMSQHLRDIAEQMNKLSEGRQDAHYNEHTAAPTTGVYALGDFVRHGSAHETGSVGDKHTFAGFQCVSEGSASAASFVEVHWSTGN